MAKGASSAAASQRCNRAVPRLRLTAMVSFLISLMLLAPSQQVAKDPARDDAQVVSAVLTQTVRREVDKLLARPDGWRGSPLVILLDRTIPVCPDKTGHGRNAVVNALNDAVVDELAATFETLNLRSITIR